MGRGKQLSGNEIVCTKGPGVSRRQNTSQVLGLDHILGK